LLSASTFGETRYDPWAATLVDTYLDTDTDADEDFGES